MAAASELNRPDPACASEHVALSPRSPGSRRCVEGQRPTTLGPQSHDDDPWLVGDALKGRGLVPTSSSPLRSQNHGDNASPGADLDSLGSLPLSGSWTPNVLRSMSFENLQFGSVSHGSESVPTQAGSNSRQCDGAALVSSYNSLFRAFAGLDSVRGDHGTSGCHHGHRKAVNVEQQVCRTLLPPSGNCSREAATKSCTVSHTCQGATGSGDNMQSLAGLARRAAGGSHHSNWDAGTAHGGVGDRSASIRDKNENTRSAASQHCLGSLPGKMGVAAAASAAAAASTDEFEGSFSAYSGRWRRSTREMASSTDEVQGSFSADSGRRRRSTREMAAAAAAASAAAETAEANNKNKNCHFREDAPKRSPLFACCSPTCDQVCLPVSHVAVLVFASQRVCAVACSWAPDAAASHHPTRVSTRCCFCAVALKLMWCFADLLRELPRAAPGRGHTFFFAKGRQ